ncbi:MAG: single-stranded DNA-binding protein [Flavobacteriaceae bacterium CG2_30_31_66]|nr:MAG: single-stranded DNA-binding protein [Flavobacteriaceae bacterium CG2_30_31_66]
MNSIKNKVQLIGRLGQDPDIKTFSNGEKIARFNLAIDDSYKDKQGNKVERTYWHPIVVKNGLVSIVENYVTKGKEIAIEGKLVNRTWDDTEGKKQYVVEVVANEILLLGK